MWTRYCLSSELGGMGTKFLQLHLLLPFPNLTSFLTGYNFLLFLSYSSKSYPGSILDSWCQVRICLQSLFGKPKRKPGQVTSRRSRSYDHTDPDDYSYSMNSLALSQPHRVFCICRICRTFEFENRAYMLRSLQGSEWYASPPPVILPPCTVEYLAHQPVPSICLFPSRAYVLRIFSLIQLREFWFRWGREREG